METIGERIRRIREAKGISRKDLARAVGLSYTGLASLETGQASNTPKLHRIATVLDVSVEGLESGAQPVTPIRAAAERGSHTVGLDPDKLAETARALRERYEAAGLVYSIEDDPETFVEAYAYNVAMIEKDAPKNMRALGMKVADLTSGLSRQGAVPDESEQGVPAQGTVKRKDGEAGNRKT